ncbi:hypothetical protein LX32DRAFT_693808 [Colletotrichum zoysiae]|uniref:Uncharacterized protein n=1 Tax=Colletotrichum zoysiae TaxID=1216348 RepID=A0AAD9HIN6_9PEZI|nr:hypothetical protein LX32DRAFT_693808 [Colletotrichum zoysiae]
MDDLPAGMALLWAADAAALGWADAPMYTVTSVSGRLCTEVPSSPGPAMRCARTAPAPAAAPDLDGLVFTVVPCSVAILWGLHRCARLWGRPKATAAAVAQGSILPVRFLAGCAVLSVLLWLTLPFSLFVAPASAVLASGLVVAFRHRDRLASPQGSRLLTRKMVRR